jgi:beta-glucanase (GH16 family)
VAGISQANRPRNSFKPARSHHSGQSQYHDASGGTYFRGGYFEARLKCSDWSAFWLFCADRPTVWDGLVNPNNPLTWTNEIDIIETDPNTPQTAYLTLHKNTSGDGGVPDQFREPHIIPTAFTLIGQWHTYGLLWTQIQISWYIDN